MKYLKTFESLENISKGYEVISHEEICMDLSGGLLPENDEQSKFIEEHWEDFTDSEFSQIENLMGPSEYPEGPRVNTIHKQRIDTVRRKLWIFKLVDEWYYVKWSPTKSEHDEFFEPHETTYYKCDQFDGLLNCLRYIKSRYQSNKSLFESVNRNYQIANSVELEAVANRNNIPFENKDIQQIESIVRGTFEITHKYNRNGEIVGLYIDRHSSDHNISWDKPSFYIFSQEDEYFYVRENLIGCPYIFYECDQIGGLIQCLKEELLSTIK